MSVVFFKISRLTLKYKNENDLYAENPITKKSILFLLKFGLCLRTEFRSFILALIEY